MLHLKYILKSFNSSNFYKCLHFRRSVHGECLKNRSLLKVEGQDTKEFLQGIITNDIEHLDEPNISSIYTMLLNVQGRVLFDGFIMKQQNDYVIDCDAQILDAVINHMKLYKVRRKISFQRLDEYYKVWVLFDKDINLVDLPVDLKSTHQAKNKVLPFLDNLDKLPKEAIITKDPRLKYLGDRIILPANESLLDFANVDQIEDGEFQKFRFKLGVGEGVDDFSRGKSLPLESNCDYLHGVSLQKGCYIGQELTARTYHTGVIRKRIMPLFFYGDGLKFEKDASITNENGKKIGKFINASGRNGIGLLRINEALSAQTLNIGDVTFETLKPRWWPVEASKDRQNS